MTCTDCGKRRLELDAMGVCEKCNLALKVERERIRAECEERKGVRS